MPGLLARLEAAGAESVAICLLHSYVNPAHERRLKALIEAARPGLPVTLSSGISPEIREYERASTTVLNALLVPVVKDYLDRLARRLEIPPPQPSPASGGGGAGYAPSPAGGGGGAGDAPSPAGGGGRDPRAAREGGGGAFDPLVFLVQSNGGVCSLATAAAQPARLLLSGPSGGALAAGRIAALLERPNLVAVDMGGTSFDVSVVQGGRIGVVTQGEVDGLPVRLPMVEMRTIGAGGGSIASVDAGGRLTVGPRSAGARPGPVAYGRGGTEPTVTDANLALGRLDPDYFLGGAMTLDMAATRAAIAAKVGTPLGLTVEQAAQGILTVTNANLGAAVRLSLFEKGLDPRDFTLLSFGGAGGLHATDVATEMGIAEVIFPREPGTLSAHGILYSDLVQDLARSRVLPARPESLPAIAALLGELRAEAAARLAADGVAPEAQAIELGADMRYHGQAFELLVPWPEAPDLPPLLARFHAMHRSRFSYADAQEAVEIVTLRVTAIGRLPKPAATEPVPAARPALKGSRRVFEDGAWRDVPVWDREALPPEDRIAGPALVEEAFATHWIGRGWEARLGAAGALIASRASAPSAKRIAP
ncbi:MAG: hydantoinase/oxoprolinase family protein [Acetobacteraceae bacterium]|nr:hydantoinase/oxoprolinase family protein [Acetobacteraceae bacterium]